jgi:transcriptional regulator with GAF, ATPase, and Fis domain
VVFVLLSDYYFLPPPGKFAIGSVSDGVRLFTAILAAAAVIWFVHVSRDRQILLQKRKDLLQDVSPMILRSLDAEEILDTVAEATLRVIDYQHFRLYRWDEAADGLVLVKSVARADPYTDIDWHLMTLSLGEGITGIAAKTQHSILVPDASRDARMVYPAGTVPIEESILSVPMVTRGRLFGVLSLARLGTGSLSTEDMRLMESIAAQTALALANAEQYAEAEQTIKALATMPCSQATARIRKSTRGSCTVSTTSASRTWRRCACSRRMDATTSRRPAAGCGRRRMPPPVSPCRRRTWPGSPIQR